MIDHSFITIIIAGVIACATAWGVGAADLANVLSTSIGSKAVKVSTAICIAIIFECAGAFWGGGQVSHTLSHDVINMNMVQDTQILIDAMLSVSLAGASWMIIASACGLPASITNAIVGALVGFGCSVFGFAAVNWNEIWHIALSWILSPLISAFFSYLIFVIIQRLILIRPNPDRYMKRYFPFYCFIVGVIFANMIIVKILDYASNATIKPSHLLISISTGLLFVLIGILIGRAQKESTLNDRRSAFGFVEKKFSILMLFTACAMVFAHGSNDVPISVAPLNIIVHTLSQKSHCIISAHLNTYILLLGSFSVILGLLMYGRKVIKTVGSGITTLTPSRAFSATIVTACIVVCSTSTGIPVSVTQTLVGGVLGVGLARGVGALNLNVIRNIFLSWFITIPATSLLAMFYFYLGRQFLNF